MQRKAFLLSALIEFSANAVLRLTQICANALALLSMICSKKIVLS